MPMQLRGMQTRARAGLEPKPPRRADQLQAKPHLVRERRIVQKNMCSFNALNTRSRHTTTWLQVLLGVRFIPPIIRMHLDGFSGAGGPCVFPLGVRMDGSPKLAASRVPFLSSHCTDLDAWCVTGNVLLSLSSPLSLFLPLHYVRLFWCPGTVIKPGVSCMDTRIIQLRW